MLYIYIYTAYEKFSSGQGDSKVYNSFSWFVVFVFQQATINSVFGPMDRSLNTRTSPLTWIDFAKSVSAVCLYEKANDFFNQNLKTLRLTLAMWKGTKQNDEDSTMLFWEGGSIDMAGLNVSKSPFEMVHSVILFSSCDWMCVFSRFGFPCGYLACIHMRFYCQAWQ